MDDAFGHWLAGFIDGEGSFSIQETGCSFRLGLRYDDRPILDAIAAETGIGKVAEYQATGARHPTAIWIASSLEECQLLAALLKRYPLRAKKARDLAVWGEAVELCDQLRATIPAAGDRRSPERRAGLERLGELRRQLVDGRSPAPTG